MKQYVDEVVGKGIFAASLLKAQPEAGHQNRTNTSDPGFERGVGKLRPGIRELRVVEKPRTVERRAVYFKNGHHRH